jgi:hypothetical protein
VESLYACDFFSVETLGLFGPVRHMRFFVIEVVTPVVHIAGILVDPVCELLVDITDGLSFSVVAELHHDSDPPFDVPRSDRRVSNKITVSWRGAG